MRLNIDNCSACGQSHAQVQAVELVQPVALITHPEAGAKWSHFFLCPTNQQQVFLRLAPDENLDDQPLAEPVSAT